MKMSSVFLTFLFSVCAVAGQEVSGQSLKFDPRSPLYLSDGSKYGFNQINEALDRAFSYGKPVVLFIHGRGNEPEKSLEGGTFVDGRAVHKLEGGYDVRVVMFNWESKAWLTDRDAPLSKMDAAAVSFKKVVDVIRRYDLNGKKLTLLAHSMGSIVLETYIKKYGWGLSPLPLFSNVLLTSPDADNKTHASWMATIAQKEKVFVTINQDDDVLEQSTDARPAGVKALGLRPTNTSDRVTYLDFTKVSDRRNKATGVHEIFYKPNMKGQKHICHALSGIIRSESVDIKKMADPVDRPNYLKFKFEIFEHDGCFQ